MRRAALAAGAAGALLLGLAGPTTDVLGGTRLSLLGAALGASTAFDVAERRIPNPIVLPPLPLFAALDLARSPSSFGSALLIAAVPLALSLLRPAALGMGDAKLVLLIALALQRQALLALLAATACAACYGLALAQVRKQRALSLSLPLAPFLAIGAAIAVVA